MLPLLANLPKRYKEKYNKEPIAEDNVSEFFRSEKKLKVVLTTKIAVIEIQVSNKSLFSKLLFALPYMKF